MHNDNDDDGETAAGSRLAHLLQILVSLLPSNDRYRLLCTWLFNVDTL